MQTDGPTLSNLPQVEPGAAESPPTWPEPPEGRQRAFGHDRPTVRDPYIMILGVSFFANVVLIIALISVLFATHTGFFASGSPSPGVSAPASALSSPTATAASSPTSSSGGWLQITPSSVHLGCNGDQQTQTVMLTNSGPRRVGWQADLPGSGDQAPVSVNPNQGELHAGATVAIQIQINTSSTGSQGIIRFDPANTDAGAPPTLSYTADSCNSGG